MEFLGVPARRRRLTRPLIVFSVRKLGILRARVRLDKENATEVMKGGTNAGRRLVRENWPPSPTEPRITGSTGRQRRLCRTPLPDPDGKAGDRLKDQPRWAGVDPCRV